MKISITSGDGVITYQATISGPTSTADTTSASTEKTASADTVEDFSTVLENHTTVADELDTVTTYKDIFKEASDTYNIDYYLLTAVAQQESDFNPNATSASGAMGIMQLMPSTAASLGCTDAYDPYENIMAGAKYLSEMLEEFSGNVDMALAAYNAGAGTVKEYGGVPAIASVQNYVSSIRSIMEQGASVPDKNYYIKSATTEEVTADLEKLLAEFDQHQSYDEFVSQMAQLEAENPTDDSTDAQVAYQNMLTSAQTVINNMLAEG